MTRLLLAAYLCWCRRGLPLNLTGNHHFDPGVLTMAKAFGVPPELVQR